MQIFFYIIYHVKYILTLKILNKPPLQLKLMTPTTKSNKQGFLFIKQVSVEYQLSKNIEKAS